MFCPQCGQRQTSNEARFCSSCGFQLYVVTELLKTGGQLTRRPPAPGQMSPRSRGLRQGAMLMLSTVVVVPVVVQWGDQDAFVHVNNTVYFRWMESARIAYGQRIGLLDLLAAQQIGPILASIHNLTYLHRLTRRIRAAISEGRFGQLRSGVLEALGP